MVCDLHSITCQTFSCLQPWQHQWLFQGWVLSPELPEKPAANTQVGLVPGQCLLELRGSDLN